MLGWLKVGIIVFCLLGSGCFSIKIKTVSRAKNSSLHFDDVVSPLVRLGRVNHERLTNFVMDITISDSEQKPVSYALLILKYDAHADTFPADSFGRLRLKVSEKMVEGNPKIVAEKNGILLNSKFLLSESPKPEHHPIKEEFSTRHRLSELLRRLTETGLFTREQLIAIQFQVTLLDSTNNPVPQGRLILDYKTHIDTMRADSSGSIPLRLTYDMIDADPEISGKLDAEPLRIRIKLYGQLTPGFEPQVIDTDSFSRRFEGTAAVLYKPTDTPLVDSVLEVVLTQQEYIRTKLLIRPIPWGVVLLDSPFQSYILKETELVRDTVRYHLFPYSSSEWRKKLYTDNFWRLTKNSLFETVGVPDEGLALWLFNGLPSYWHYRYLIDLKQQDMLPPEAVLYEPSSWKLLDSLFHTWPERMVNIIDWVPRSGTDWLFAQAVFLAFWKEIHNRYGDSAVAKFIQGAASFEILTPDQLINALIKETGPAVRAFLTAFPSRKVLEIVTKIHQEVDQR